MEGADGCMSQIVVALLGVTGTLAGSFLGVVAASRLTNYRLQQLEEELGEGRAVENPAAVSLP